MGAWVLFIPLVLLVFAVMHWSDTKKWFVIWVIGTVVYFIGAAMVAPAMLEQAQELNPGQ